MNNFVKTDFYEHAGFILDRMSKEGVVCSVIDKDMNTNLITLGWGLIGRSYRGRPMFAIAVTPQRYSWRFLEDVPEFVIGAGGEGIEEKMALCGKFSGRDIDKFQAAGFTPVKGEHVNAPLLKECLINVECRIYTKVEPPHMLLTPEHRKRPVNEQHTIYFAEVMAVLGRKIKYKGVLYG